MAARVKKASQQKKSEGKASKPSKAQRLNEIRRLIESGKGDSQVGLVNALEEKGLSVTQATVSRDLDSLGAIRTKTDLGFRYVLSDSSVSVSYTHLTLPTILLV